MEDNKSSFHFSFVILHYVNLDVTENCINSILQNIKYENYSIIIVDNGSPNQSGKALQEKYDSDHQIEIILLEENLGFAKGNNIGFKEAKEHYQADFVVVANNDVLFQSPDFINKIIEIYNRTNCYLLGPDIVTPNGVHQNPYRTHELTYSEIKKKLRNREIFLSYLKVKKTLHIENKIHILEDAFGQRDDQMHSQKNWDTAQEDIVLHGSCIIYTPLFLGKEICAFLPDTFMYGEEDLLANMCTQKKYKVYYSPEIQVLHLYSKSTEAIKDTTDRLYFKNENIIKGQKLLLKKLKDD